MTGTQALAGRAAIGVVASIAGILAARSRRLEAWDDARFKRRICWAFVASRLLIFVLLFGVLRIAPRGDIPGFYTPEAEAVLVHQMPYRDFLSSYAPMHPYLDAVALLAWRSPLAIMLLALLVEMLVLPLWFRIGQEFLPMDALRTASLLYLMSPISLQYVTVDGQDNVIIAVLLVVGLWLLMRNRTVASGLAVGLSVCLTKLIPLVFAPVFFLASRHRWRWGLSMMGLVGIVYGGFLVAGLPLLEPLKIEGALRTAGNLPYLVETVMGRTVPNGVWNAVTLVALGSVWGVVGRASFRLRDRKTEGSEVARLRVIMFGMVATAVALMMFSKKSWPAYLMLVLFPVYLLFADRNRKKLWLLAGFSVVVAVEHSVWATLLVEMKAPALHVGILRGDRICLTLFVLELLLLSGYAWLLMMSAGRIDESGRAWQAGGGTLLNRGTGGEEFTSEIRRTDPLGMDRTMDA